MWTYMTTYILNHPTEFKNISNETITKLMNNQIIQKVIEEVYDEGYNKGYKDGYNRTEDDE